jgi:uncharacterized metal-binding protein
LVTSVTIGVTSCYLTGIGVTFGYLLGRYIDPDIDQLVVTNAEGRLLRELGLIGAIIVAFLFPYAYMSRWVGGHRSFLTHFPVISTALRLLYILVPLMMYKWSLFENENFLLFLLGTWIGLSISDFTHWILDVLF